MLRSFSSLTTVILAVLTTANVAAAMEPAHLGPPTKALPSAPSATVPRAVPNGILTRLSPRRVAAAEAAHAARQLATGVESTARAGRIAARPKEPSWDAATRVLYDANHASSRREIGQRYFEIRIDGRTHEGRYGSALHDGRAFQLLRDPLNQAKITIVPMMRIKGPFGVGSRDVRNPEIQPITATDITAVAKWTLTEGRKHLGERGVVEHATTSSTR